VDIKVVNEKSDQIKVTKISYQVDGKGTAHSEDLSDKEIGKNGGSHTWKSQNLQHAPAGSKLTFRVFFKNDKVGGWGDEVSQEFDRLGNSCTDGRSYSFTVK
jgi:general stress protein YciG